MDKLIEMMTEKLMKTTMMYAKDCKDVSKECLSVILDNIELVAEVCPECGGDGYMYTSVPCNVCNGKKVVAKKG